MYPFSSRDIVTEIVLSFESSFASACASASVIDASVMFLYTAPENSSSCPGTINTVRVDGLGSADGVGCGVVLAKQLPVKSKDAAR